MFNSHVQLESVAIASSPERAVPTLEQLKTQARIDADSDDAWLESNRALVWRRAESITGHLWGSRTVTYILTASRRTQCKFDFHRPVVSLDRAYILRDGAFAELDGASALKLDVLNRIELQQDTYKLEFTIGDTDAPEADIIAFVTQIVGTLYDNRHVGTGIDSILATDGNPSILLADYRRAGIAVRE